MTEFEILQLLAGPFTLVAVLLVALWRPWRRGVEDFAIWTLPVSFGAGYALTHHSISSFPSYPPVTADEWLVYVVLAAGIWGAIEGYTKLWERSWVSLVRLVIVGVGFWVMFGHRLELWAFVAVVAILSLWIAVVDRLSRGEAEVSSGWIVGCSAAALGGILLMGASLKLALLAWGLMAMSLAMGVVTMAARLRSGQQVVPAPLWLLVGVVLAGLGLNGVEYALAPGWAVMGTLALIPLALGGGRWLHERGWKRWQAGAVSVGLAVVGAASSVGYAYYETEIAEEETEADEEEEYDPYTW